MGTRRSAEQEAAFRLQMDDAKGRANLSDLIRRHTALRTRGRELVGLCPFHNEKTPSFEVNDAKGVFFCHGCAATGDHFTVLTKLDKLTFRDAYAALTGGTFPAVDPAQRARAAAEDAKAWAGAIEDARFMWAKCVDPRGTPAEAYLRGRDITILPAAVRFGVVPTSRDDEGNWKRPYPAVVLPCHDERDGVVGLQRIFITDDGSDKRWGKRSKLSLGRPRGAPVRLAPACDEVVICEGPEDGLSLAQELPGSAVWVALGTAMMPEIRFPPAVKRVVIAGQNDAAGRAATDAAAEAITLRGLQARTIWPDERYNDWNDQLRGIAS